MMAVNQSCGILIYKIITQPVLPDEKTLTCLSNYFMGMPDIKFIKQ